MLKYCKISEDGKSVQVGTGSNINFYKSIGFTLQEVEEVDGVWYLKGMVPEPNLERKKQELKQELENKFYREYPLYKQCNIAIYGAEEERQRFKEFHDKLVEEYDKQISELK